MHTPCSKRSPSHSELIAAMKLARPDYLMNLLVHVTDTFCDLCAVIGADYYDCDEPTEVETPPDSKQQKKEKIKCISHYLTLMLAKRYELNASAYPPLSAEQTTAAIAVQPFIEQVTV